MLIRFVGYKKITEVGNNFLSTVTELQRQIILCKNMESKFIFRKEVFGYDVKVGLFKMQEKLKSFYSIITQVVSINWHRGEFLKFRNKTKFYHLSCPN